MPYYNNYQQNYQPYPNYQSQSPLMGYQQPQYSMTPQPQQSNTITWVQGEVGARAYPVTPGSSTLLMDSDDKYFYIKSADASGMPSLRKYAYNEVIDEVPKLEQHSYGPQDYDTAKLASRDEVKELQTEIEKLKEHITSLESMKNNNRGGKQNG